MNPPNMEPVSEPDQVRLDRSEDLVEMQHRVARLETGIRLVAETLRRVHADLSGTLSDLREEVVLTATSVDIRRIVTEGLQPVEAALQSLAAALQPGTQLESMVGIPQPEAGEDGSGEEIPALDQAGTPKQASAAQHPSS